LRRLGLEGETIVVYSADHGKALGEWGATEKGFFDSEVWRVPYILSGPGVPDPGRTESGLCELVDTGRTLLSLVGLGAPAWYRGRDLLNDPPPPAVFGEIGWPDPRAPIFGRAYSSRVSEVKGEKQSRATARALPPRPPRHSQMRAAVRTDRHRMDVTWYKDGERVPVAEADGNLFDLQADPYETTNLWKSPEALGTVYELWLKLDAWFATLDWPPELFEDGKP
jgi:arylsulfatase A-like enzyme